MTSVRDLQRMQGGKRGSHPRSASGAERDHEAEGHERATEDEEKLRIEREQKELEAAQQQLALPIGGTPASKFKIQVTGGEIEVPATKAGTFQKDQDIEIVVGGLALNGWVKTIKNTTEKRNGPAARVAVVVIEEA